MGERSGGRRQHFDALDDIAFDDRIDDVHPETTSAKTVYR